MSKKPDIVARVRLYPTTDGGREAPLQPRQFSCPLFFQNEGFDCRLLLDLTGETLFPGAEAEVPIKFLFPENVKPRLKPGDSFKLWDLKYFAEGEVLKII